MKRHVVTRILSLALALMLALPCFTAALAEGPSSETLLLGEGTAAETQARIDDSGVEGPAILFVAGTHGNEWAGYYAADELMAEIFPTAGKVIWVPARQHPGLRDRAAHRRGRGQPQPRLPWRRRGVPRGSGGCRHLGAD